MIVVIEWYDVSFDENTITLQISAPGKEERSSTRVSIQWQDIIRICIKCGDFLVSDELHVFVSHREESYVIPLDANGGFKLWEEIINRGLFDPLLAIKAAMGMPEEIFCHPSS